MALVFIGVFLLIVDLHRTSEKEVLSQFQEHQLIHARHLAGQINSYFENCLSGLQALSSFPSLQNVEPMERRTDLEAYLRQMKKVHVKAISVLEERGIVVESTDPKSQSLDFGSRDFFTWAKKKENQGKVLASSYFPNSPPYHFKVLVVTPIYQDASDAKHSKRSRKFVGALLLLIDFEEFLSKQLTFIDPSTSLHDVWIIDKEGTLLYQPEHKDMVLRNIYRRDNNCIQCHASFEYVEKILKERQGKVDYEMKKSPKKLAAFAPVDFENASWIVVVSSVYNEVLAFERKSLRDHLMLLGIVVSVLIGGFILLNRNYQQKLKAEEEVRHWKEKRVLEDKIQQSEVRYRTIVENAHDAIWTVDSQGNFTFINRSGEEISGYKVSELVGTSCVSLIYPEDLPKMKDLFFETLQGKPQSFEVRFYAKDGEIHVLSVNAVPLYENSSVIGLFNIGRDITEHKKTEDALRKNEEKYRTLVETMNDGLTVLDENDQWTYVNDKFCHMLGCFSGELVGHSVFEFLDESNRRILEEQLSKRRKGEYTSYEIELARKDGTNIPTIVSPKPIFDPEGRFKGSLAIVTDITERKQNELALLESERQLRHLSAQLMAIQEQERKRISSELHDELGQALALMKLRLKSIERGLTKDQTQIREECNSTLRYINGIIENVRRLSRDLSPSILEDLGLSSALRWMVDEFRKLYHIDVTLDMEKIDHLFSRKAQIILYRIFQEALTNIGKHAQATRVSIAAKKEGDKISFTVEDDGRGFDLSRAAQRDVTQEGIGLAIMKERVRMLGGSLHLVSQEIGGTRITFTIPPGGENGE